MYKKNWVLHYGNFDYEVEDERYDEVLKSIIKQASKEVLIEALTDSIEDKQEYIDATKMYHNKDKAYLEQEVIESMVGYDYFEEQLKDAFADEAYEYYIDAKSC